MENFQDAEVVLKKLFKRSFFHFDTPTILSTNADTFAVRVLKLSYLFNCLFSPNLHLTFINAEQLPQYPCAKYALNYGL